MFDKNGQPINLGEVLLRGLLQRSEEEAHQTREERGRLRGGSVGFLLPDGTPIGFGCPRAAYARYLGAEPPREETEWALNHLMLDSGAASEGLWLRDLNAGLAAMGHETHVVEHELAIEAKLSGVKWTGREDLGLRAIKSGEHTLFCELKQVSSMSTAASVLLARKPKIDHFTQAVNYSLRGGVPSQLWYVSRVKLPFPPWNWLEPFKYGTYDDDPRFERFFERTGSTQRSKLKQLKPFLIGFQLAWTEDGHATYQTLLPDGPVGEEVVTPITREGIDAFYAAVVAHETKGRLHPQRPEAADVDGVPHGRFSPCGWCDWLPTCDAHEGKFDSWKEEVLSYVRQVPPKGK